MTANLEVIHAGPLPKLRTPMAITENAQGHITTACDDGTVWKMFYDPIEDRDWIPLKSVPGTKDRPEGLPEAF